MYIAIHSHNTLMAFAVAVSAAASAKSPPAATNDADDFVSDFAKSAVDIA